MCTLYTIEVKTNKHEYKHTGLTTRDIKERVEEEIYGSQGNPITIKIKSQ